MRRSSRLIGSPRLSQPASPAKPTIETLSVFAAADAAAARAREGGAPLPTPSAPSNGRSRELARSSRALLLYSLMLVGTLLIFLVVNHLGAHLTAPLAHDAPLARSSAALQSSKGMLAHLLTALTVIMVSASLLGTAFRYLGQPPVVGEMIAGVLLGPTLLGRIAPGLSAAILPDSVAPALAVIAQIGIVLYMFIIGLELDFKLLSRGTHASIAISHASIVAPFILGALLALALFPQLSTSDVSFTHFALFCGVAMSVTAFPVLARILNDRSEHTSRIGALALTCAAVDDVTAWCLLALVTSVVGGRFGGALQTVGLTLAYMAGMWFLARPLVARVLRRFELRGGTVTKLTLTVVLLFALGSALTTEFIGIHAVFGAFVAGALIPADSRLAQQLTGALQNFLIVLFLPAFFAYAGMRTQIGLVSSPQQWLLCALVLATACAGKFGGTFLAARFAGLGSRDSAALGILMNTRGLMELIVLNIGLDLGILSPTLFAMFVIMAIVTTLATTPLLNLLRRRASPVVLDAVGSGHLS
jgi:Kef-type K+ transport system membrane component KefB